MTQDRDRDHLHLVGLDLLAEVLGRAADHQAGDEDGEDREDQHAVQARADAAEDDFAELHQHQRHDAAERRERVVHGVDRAARRRRGDGREQPERRCRSAPPCLPCCRRAAARSPSGRRRATASSGLPALLRADTRPTTRRRTRSSSPPARPSPGACRPPCGRRRSTAPPGSGRSTSICTKFESGVGFSYGCAELALKKPPPLVPSILIASCEATGPIAIVCVVGRARPPSPDCPSRPSAACPAASIFGLLVGGDLERRRRPCRRRSSGSRPG